MNPLHRFLSRASMQVLEHHIKEWLVNNPAFQRFAVTTSRQADEMIRKAAEMSAQQMKNNPHWQNMHHNQNMSPFSRPSFAPPSMNPNQNNVMSMISQLFNTQQPRR
ncbi:unnamed protein product [Vitrella brassicaformis CCMP3155]|uniref:Uncharacterized protein n=1 Tax=Vitrella brassicaformis (strain CCMP3155) TaxID=1169540 RepID=A0A0G4FX99_VITBC|nr:unnamed protein product [Vitrella brassicaformis CCMP3155]|eukprot:CEM19615.1 unnamed protein product [Vitrella brassicaformis CCMP3155]